MAQTALHILFNTIAAALIWAAADLKRKPDSKIEICSKWWWIQLIFISVGLSIVISTTNHFNH